MFAFVFDAKLFTFTYRAPQSPALVQLPPTSATHGDAPRIAATLPVIDMLHDYAGAVRPRSPNYAASGGGVINERRDPMLAFVYDAKSYTLTHRAPQSPAYGQLPPTSA